MAKVKPPHEMFREYEHLKRNIERLKQIEKELDLLDTEGFESDVLKIKSKLKDPESLDQAKREFDLLKRKINTEQQRKEAEKEGTRRQRRKSRKKEQEEVSDLIHKTRLIIENAISKATNAKDFFWLNGVYVLKQELKDFTEEFESGQISPPNAKPQILKLKDRAETLSSPPSGEEEYEEEEYEEETYYDVLGIDPSASQEEIRRAYRQKMNEYHPDKVASWAKDDAELPPWVKEKIEEMPKKLNEAYQVLSDPLKRGEYDRKIGRQV